MRYIALIFIIAIPLVGPALSLTQQCGTQVAVSEGHNQCLMDTVSAFGFEYWQGYEAMGLVPNDFFGAVFIALAGILFFGLLLVFSTSYMIQRNALLLYEQRWRIIFGSGRYAWYQ